jgi:hypothetical protein
VFWAVDRHLEEEKLVPNKPFEDHLIERVVEGEGSLHLLPVGPVGPPLLGLLGGYRWQAWMRPRDTERDWAMAMVTELKNAIAAMEKPPKYVIVDTTAGLDAAAYRVLKDLADQACFLMTHEPGERVVSTDIAETFEDGKFHRVISRVPTSTEDVRAYASRLNWPEAAEFPVLQYDPEFGPGLKTSIPLEDPFIRIRGADGKAMASDEPYQLTFDHLRLLAKVLGPDELRSTVQEPVRGWLDEALDRAPEPYYKIFMRDKGALTNPSDPEQARNVSFRVESIRNIFQDVWQALEQGEDRTVAFAAAGRHAGNGYGESLRKEMERSGSSLDEALRRWCQEDTNVGFGSLQVRDFDPEARRGVVWIHDVFLPPEVSNASLLPAQAEGGAAIFEGYVRGVLTALLGDDELPIRIQWAERLQEGSQIVPSASGPHAAIRFEPN